MIKSQKHESVAAIKEIYKNFNTVIVTHYHGLTVAQITTLRKSLRSNNASLKIVKNTLSKIAASKTEVDSISTLFKGPSAIAYSDDPIAVAKCIVGFAKTNEQLKIVGGVVNTHLLDTGSVQKLATLPSLDELRGKIIGLLQAPAAKIASLAQAPAAQLARVLHAHSTKS